jgi:hypothetical protein
MLFSSANVIMSAFQNAKDKVFSNNNFLLFLYVCEIFHLTLNEDNKLQT